MSALLTNSKGENDFLDLNQPNAEEAKYITKKKIKRTLEIPSLFFNNLPYTICPKISQFQLLTCALKMTGTWWKSPVISRFVRSLYGCNILYCDISLLGHRVVFTEIGLDFRDNLWKITYYFVAFPLINSFNWFNLSTKSLTAIAVAALHDEGLLDYETRFSFFVTDWLTTFIGPFPFSESNGPWLSISEN